MPPALLATVPASSPEIVELETYSRSVTLLWRELPPHDQNGVILGYTVTITDLDEGVLEDFITEDLNITLTDLIPYTTYGLVLSAHTAIGEGPSGDLHTIRTDEEGM